jgi:hypothetical protein
MMRNDTRIASPNGIILVAHEILAPIMQEDMLAALPQEFLSLPREMVHLRAVSAKLSELAEFDWASARHRQSNEIQTRLKPLIDANPTWRVQYFGTAPIPLAMDFGYIIGGWTSVDVYQQRHDDNSWRWLNTARSTNVTFQPTELSKERIVAEGDLVIRVSMSHRIDPMETATVVPNSLGDVDIALQSPNEDAFESVADIEALKEQFDKVIDWAHATRPNADIHVFAAVTVGAAFRLGMAVNPTIHSPVHVYQYSKASSPHYQRVLVLQGDIEQIGPLSPEQIKGAAGLRELIKLELDRIRNVTAELHELDLADPAQTWMKVALRSICMDVGLDAFSGQILELAKIYETPLLESSVDLSTTATPDSFWYDAPSRMWKFDDRFLVALNEQFNDQDARRQAGRLLLLHEGVHLKTHGLTETTAREVRRFPKIVEELDYQADVWAFLHDYSIELAGTNPSNQDTRAFFINVVTVALDTFWAFDANGDQQRIEIRRLNRYLIWYWQLLRLELSSDLTGVLRVLANRPVIEIAGPKVESLNNRIYYSLDPARFNEPELGLLYKQRIIRYGHAPGARVKDILIGFRDRDKNKIRDALKSISDQIP